MGEVKRKVEIDWKIWPIVQGDSFGTRPKKMRISQTLFIRF
jgi:hypothetical protein